MGLFLLMKQGDWCEGCQQVRWSAMRRPDFDRVLCSECNLEALREDPPTGLVRRLGYYLVGQAE